ncbi:MULTISPECIES: hypothetical protein [Acinetobacter]|uniref:Lipoprotein n=1 Tax=Acinetobacter schindleri CIP 107287 TaxID=1217988 RepID=N9ADP4_9GAMM|nr:MULTISPECIES: hypothetical protein [Acinetobacter]ENV44214.1 hypothetical protein F955_02103 [Acinetobacter schindleri CIP 107287]ENW23336.1 hypothetical protein F925_02294 [Acinetobacter lwoffii NCTC 5866 = CIP 64.10 = NIPH 512]QXB84958.1 hypothetical protein I6L24_09030 [Acinetobacter lwoffii]
MKHIVFLLVFTILTGCSQQEFNAQSSNPEILKEQQLKSIREITKTFLPNPDSAKFRNQIGECGEVSYRDKDNKYTAFQRFVVIEKNIVLVENQTDQKQFELSWNSACIPSWNK